MVPLHTMIMVPDILLNTTSDAAPDFSLRHPMIISLRDDPEDVGAFTGRDNLDGKDNTTPPYWARLKIPIP